MERFDSPEGDLFAIITQGVDRHRLRVFDTHTGTVNNDFSSEKEDNFTCLSWGNVIIDDLNGKVDAPPPKKRKRRISQNQQYSKVIALGLQNGSIIIYSLTHGDIIKTLSGSHTLPINDFVFTKDGKKAYSCAEDMNIVEWDLEKENVISKWKLDAQTTKFIISLSHDETKLLTAGHTIKLWDLQTKQVLKSFTGHASTITNIIFSSDDDICVSIAEHDRFINIWKCQDDDGTQGVNLAAYTLDDNARSLSMSKANTVLAISETGSLNLFKNVSSISLKASSSSNVKKKKKYTTRTPDCIVKVIDDKGTNIIPILSACFVDELENKETGFVKIARGSTVKPNFEKVRFINEENGEFLQELTLKRHQPSGFLIDESNLAAKNLKAKRKSYEESKVNVIGISNFETPRIPINLNELSIQDNTLVNGNKKLEITSNDLDSLNYAETKKNPQTSVKSKFQSIQGNSMQQMLVQALHSNDDDLFHLVLEQTDPDIINNTAKKLPTKYVIPFLEKVILRFQEKPNAGVNILQWIKVVLLVHMTYLMTVLLIDFIVF
ncbi:4730_t:CDS:2 [Diversispora eburnea]|uniref:4730_t:CDS:1 n=1 Tax=Diversispora eburnea TaxID=1213867 RepID=A0A9N8YHX2_9GLOM|nr:4730_t:CDS:2 [Diversispora eburnea]